MRLFLGISYAILLLALMFLPSWVGMVWFFLVLGLLTLGWYGATVREKEGERDDS